MERAEVLPGVFIEPRIIETRLGAVECDLSGEEGGPALLVSHGGIGGVDQARVLIDWAAGAGYRLICPSRPGYLGTPLESGESIEDQAELFAALLDALGTDRAAVVSASAGGPPAYTFAIRHPKRTWALLAIDSVSGYYDFPETAGPITQAIFTSEFGQKLVKKIGEAKPEMFLAELYKSESYFTKDQVKAHMAYVLGNPRALDFMRAFIMTMNPYKPRKAGTENDMAYYRKLTHLPLEQVRCPAMIVHGTHDADVKLYDGVYAHEHIEGAERFWIEEGSHLGFWLCPNGPAAQAAALDFLERHRP